MDCRIGGLRIKLSGELLSGVASISWTGWQAQEAESELVKFYSTPQELVVEGLG